VPSLYSKKKKKKRSNGGKKKKKSKHREKKKKRKDPGFLRRSRMNQKTWEDRKLLQKGSKRQPRWGVGGKKKGVKKKEEVLNIYHSKKNQAMTVWGMASNAPGHVKRKTKKKKKKQKQKKRKKGTGPP